MRYFFILVLQDLKERYLGSLLGIFWAFINPILTIGVMWFVFTYAFHKGEVDNFPYIVWFSTAFIPWFFISEALIHSTISIIQKSYLIKKTVFNVYLIPLIKIFSNFFVFLIMLSFYIIFLFLNKISFSIYNIQIFYYIFLMLLLSIFLGYLFSSITVFLRDFKEIVSLIIKFLFWLTPIFWSIKDIPQQFQDILSYNPFLYIIEGFRNTFLYHKWFFEDPNTFKFFIILSILGAISMYIFQKSKDHFADVL